MPDRPQSIGPPVIDPARWEDFPAFRETFLLHLTRPEFNDAFRAWGLALYALVLDADTSYLPALPDQGGFELAAAAADLRHLQGYLAESAETLEPPARARLARRAAVRLAKIAGDLAAAGVKAGAR